MSNTPLDTSILNTDLLPVCEVDNHIYKSWKATSNLSSAKFSNINIIFGHNGAGKSSLAGGIAKKYLSGNDKNTARFFSSKYVESTLLLEDKSGIRGVVSNFGEKDVDIEKQVATNNKIIGTIKTDLIKQTADRKKLADDTDQLVKDIVKRRKDKNKKIHNKPESKTIAEVVTLWIKDYDDAFKLLPGEDYNAITGNTDFSAESEALNLLIVPSIPTFEVNIPATLKTLLKTKYESMVVPEHEVVAWLQSGLHIHEKKDSCEFCGAKIDINSITKKVNAYVNNQKHQATVSLNKFKQDLEALSDLADTITKNKDTYIQVLGIKGTDLDFNKISLNYQTFKAISKTIDTKTKNMSTSAALDEKELSDAISSIIASIEIIDKAKKRASQRLLEKINRLETLVKGAIGLEIKTSQIINDNLKELKKFDEKLKQLAIKQKRLEDKNEGLLNQKSDLADFATYLNQVLMDLNLNFKLLPNGKVFTLRHADGSALKLDDISDGERNLLSLIYFYYEMLGDSSGVFKDNIKLVIIDDPISSLDDNNKFYITELMKSVLDQGSIQVFVLTHSWDDFCNLAYGRDSVSTSLFEIKKEKGISKIEQISNGKLLKPYIMLYREIDAFRQQDVATITDDVALHMPNTMRRILEEYIKFRVNVDFATASHNGDICKALFGEEILTLSNTKKQKLNQLLAVCNILSHKANQPKNPTEIHDSAKFLIGTIEQNDKYHHLKMRGD